MRHLDKIRKFNRDREHRKAMFSNMMTSFFTHERITTTLAKAKELRRLSEKAITRAKENSLHNKRMIMRRIHDRDVIAKLFDEIAPKFKEVNGGYTRIYKLGNRAGDGADLARIEFVDPAESAEKKKAKAGARKSSSRKPAAGKGSAKTSGAQTPAAENPSKKKHAPRKQAETKDMKTAAAGPDAGAAGGETRAQEAVPSDAGPAMGTAETGGDEPSAGARAGDKAGPEGDKPPTA
jgi:large subunit ribosomal protein L17